MLLQARHEDDGSPMTDDELRDELLTLLVAGHETTATALSWALERLARHPGAWARLREDDEAYVDAVIKETLRLRPVLPIVLRRLKAPMEIGGCDAARGRLGGAVHLPHAPPRATSTPTRSRSAPSASSSGPPAPTPGSPSAAACGAASARASPSSRWRPCCAWWLAAARDWRPTRWCPSGSPGGRSRWCRRARGAVLVSVAPRTSTALGGEVRVPPRGRSRASADRRRR